MDEHRTQGVYVHVVDCVFDSIFARAEGEKQVAAEDEQQGSQHGGYYYLHKKAAAENLFRRVVVALAHGYGRSGRAARADKCGESRDYHDYRQANADSRQRKAAVDGHMPDIYAVNYVIEHIDYLRYDRRKR